MFIYFIMAVMHQTEIRGIINTGDEACYCFIVMVIKKRIFILLVSCIK